MPNYDDMVSDWVHGRVLLDTPSSTYTTVIFFEYYQEPCVFTSAPTFKRVVQYVLHR